MELRGERECLECGSTWSYFDSRQVCCPECGSIRSQSVSSPRMDSTSDVDIVDSEVLTGIGENFDETLSELEERCRRYTSQTGFVEKGDLKPPTPRYVMACEIKHAATTRDAEGLDEKSRRYVVDLVHGIRDGEPPDKTPSGLQETHNLAIAETVRDYSTEVERYARKRGVETPGEVERARSLAKRTLATEGVKDDAVEGLRHLREAHDELTSYQ
ncbi:MAG: hypothetical protein ABEK59_09145 [Halobacteria archaeon]